MLLVWLLIHAHHVWRYDYHHHARPYMNVCMHFHRTHWILHAHSTSWMRCEKALTSSARRKCSACRRRCRCAGGKFIENSNRVLLTSNAQANTKNLEDVFRSGERQSNSLEVLQVRVVHVKLVSVSINMSILGGWFLLLHTEYCSCCFVFLHEGHSLWYARVWAAWSRHRRGTFPLHFIIALFLLRSISFCTSFIFFTILLTTYTSFFLFLYFILHIHE